MHLIFACAKQKSRGGRGAVLWQWENGACHVSVCVEGTYVRVSYYFLYFFYFVIKHALIETDWKAKLFLLRDKVHTDSHREMTAAINGSCQLAVCRRRNFRAPAGGEKKSARAREWFSTRKVRRTQFATTNFMHELHIYWKCFFDPATFGVVTSLLFGVTTPFLFYKSCSSTEGDDRRIICVLIQVDC